MRLNWSRFDELGTLVGGRRGKLNDSEEFCTIRVLTIFKVEV